MENRLGKSTHVTVLPQSESGIGVICTTLQGDKYKITQNPYTKKHTLWHYSDDGFDKLASGESPYDLYPLIKWR